MQRRRCGRLPTKIEILHRIAAARGRGMKRVGKHAEAEAGGKSHGFAQCHFSYSGLVGLIEERRKRTYRHVPSPLPAAELFQYQQVRDPSLRH